MRVFWRGDAPLSSHAAWRAKLGKNSQQGTSAPTLAAAWAGPVEIMGALQHQPALTGLRLTDIAVEAQSPVDEHSGDRNHDLVVRGQLPSGETVCICVEAKGGESFGATVKQQTAAAEKFAATAKKNGKASNATARLQGLLKRFVVYPHDEERVQEIRYQLLTALAGTLSEADKQGAHHAVLFIHEFLTDQRDDEGAIVRYHSDLHRFMKTVLDSEPPASEGGPWSKEVNMPWAKDLNLYVAGAVTDLRTATLQGAGTQA